MFAKIIMKNRGGICFELNGLYNWLLESLGYKVTSYAARFIDRLEEYQIRNIDSLRTNDRAELRL